MANTKSEQDILNHLNKYGINGQEGQTVWAIPTSRLAGANLISLYYNYNYKIINISEGQICVMSLGFWTGKIIDSVPDVIPMNRVKGITFKKGVLYNKLVITTEEGKLKYNVVKNLIGKKWNKISNNNLLIKYKK